MLRLIAEYNLPDDQSRLKFMRRMNLLGYYHKAYFKWKHYSE